MRESTIENNRIKAIEAGELNAYLADLDRREHNDFVTDVVALTGIHRQTFFNWKSMACRISSEGKEAIEKVAGRIIFTESSK